jgi:hypothetical protein
VEGDNIRNFVVNGYVEGRVYLLFAGGFCVGIWYKEDVLLAAEV